MDFFCSSIVGLDQTKVEYVSTEGTQSPSELCEECSEDARYSVSV